jgi:hypothetical protein
MNPVGNPNRLKLLTAILIAALVFMLGAGAATAGWIKIPLVDLSTFLPIVLKDSSPQNPTSAGSTLVVFSSAATIKGNGGGRSGMNNICYTQDNSSHFCSLPEIETAWMYRGVRFQHPFTRAWVDDPVLGRVIRHQATGTGAESVWSSYGANCFGWTNDTSSAEAYWIDTNASGGDFEIFGSPSSALCNETHAVACCK